MLGIDYEKERPKLNERQGVMFNAFCALSRRRIEYRPLQKNDIIEELHKIDYMDKALYVMESIDSYWLAKESEKIKRRHRNQHGT